MQQSTAALTEDRPLLLYPTREQALHASKLSLTAREVRQPPPPCRVPRALDSGTWTVIEGSDALSQSGGEFACGGRSPIRAC